MSTDKEKRLDDLFKKKLEDPVDEIRYEEGDWDAMEAMLDKGRKSKGIISLWPILSSVAALLLVFFGWLALKPKTTGNGNSQQQAVTIKKVDTTNNRSKISNLQATTQAGKSDTITDHGKITTQSTKKNSIPDKIQFAAQPKVEDTVIDKIQPSSPKNRFNIRNIGPKMYQQPVSTPADDKNPTIIVAASGGKNNGTTGKTAVINNPDNNAIALAKTPEDKPAIGNVQTTAKPQDVQKPADATTKGTSIAAIKQPKSKGHAQLAYRPQFSLSVIAAPDLNGVNSSFQQAKVGANLGLTFSAGISRKLTITTGALYSDKPYLTNFSNYHTTYQWQANPSQVTADCRMLDIPLNVGYQVYHRGVEKISVGTGLSSYIMLHENYKFSYEYGQSGPTNYSVPHPGKYFFGVVNLSATYERQINSKMGVSIQPYMKLPLSNVGYSQVKLQSTGVAVGLSWNLNSLTKP